MPILILKSVIDKKLLVFYTVYPVYFIFILKYTYIIKMLVVHSNRKQSCNFTMVQADDSNRCLLGEYLL